MSITRPKHETYSSAVFGGRIELGTRPAVLVVDMIRAFADPKKPFGFDLREVCRNTSRLLRIAREMHLSILFTTTAYDDPEAEAGVWLAKMPSLRELRVGRRCVELLPALGRRSHELLVTKRYASAFFGTIVASVLRAQQVDTVIIAGCTTSGCVRATAVDAVQHGFRTVVVRDCVGDRLQGAHDASLSDLDAKYCDVTSLRDLAEQLVSVQTRWSEHKSGG